MKYTLLLIFSLGLISCVALNQPQKEVTTFNIDTVGSVATQSYKQTTINRELVMSSTKPFSVFRGNNFYSVVGKDKYQTLESVAFEKISSDHSLSCISFSYNSVKTTSYKTNKIKSSVVVELYKDFCKKSIVSHTHSFLKQASADEVITSAYGAMDAVFKKYNDRK